MKTIYRTICAICVICGLTACSDFLEEQVPQATLTQDEVSHSGTTTHEATTHTLAVQTSLMASHSTDWKRVLA